MSGNFSLDDYVDVAERVEQFYEKHPEGRLVTDIVELRPDLVIVRARAYQTPDDPTPSTGHSMLAIPGHTPYTKGSEVENAETSAVGRAIAFLGFAVKKGIASRQEVRNKSQDGGGGATPPAPAARPSAALQERAQAVEEGGFWTGRLAFNPKPSSAYAGFLREDKKRGPSIGFQLKDLDPVLMRRKSANVICFGPIAIGVAGGLEGRRPEHATVWGTAREESFKDESGREVTYTVIEATRVMTDEFTVPATDPKPASGLVEDLDQLPF